MKNVIDPELVEKWPLEKHVGVLSKLLVDGENMTVLWSKWEPNASAPEHSHPHEQIGICFEGQIIITVNGVDFLVNPGEFYHIPSNAPHSERNDGLVPAVLTDFFSPIRSDLLQRHFDPHLVGK
jgi:quercetin dioxygenase-like cupin family protein